MIVSYNGNTGISVLKYSTSDTFLNATPIKTMHGWPQWGDVGGGRILVWWNDSTTGLNNASIISLDGLYDKTITTWSDGGNGITPVSDYGNNTILMSGKYAVLMNYVTSKFQLLDANTSLIEDVSMLLSGMPNSYFQFIMDPLQSVTD